MTAINDQSAGARLEALLETVDYFRMDAAQGRVILTEILEAVKTLETLLGEQMPADTRARLRETIPTVARYTATIVGSST